MASTLSKLKKYSSDPKYAQDFAKEWNNANDKTRNAYRNYSASLINRANIIHNRKASVVSRNKKSSGSNGA